MIDTLAHPDEEVKYVGVVIKQCSAVDVVVEGRLGLCVKSRVEVFLDLQRERLSWRRRESDFTKELGSYRVQAHGLDLHNPGR